MFVPALGGCLGGAPAPGQPVISPALGRRLTPDRPPLQTAFAHTPSPPCSSAAVALLPAPHRLWGGRCRAESWPQASTCRAGPWVRAPPHSHPLRPRPRWRARSRLAVQAGGISPAGPVSSRTRASTLRARSPAPLLPPPPAERLRPLVGGEAPAGSVWIVHHMRPFMGGRGGTSQRLLRRPQSARTAARFSADRRHLRRRRRPARCIRAPPRTAPRHVRSGHRPDQPARTAARSSAGRRHLRRRRPPPGRWQGGCIQGLRRAAPRHVRSGHRPDQPARTAARSSVGRRHLRRRRPPPGRWKGSCIRGFRRAAPRHVRSGHSPAI